ncbi:carbohydrate esterase family 3 protein [Hypoxylon sp. NC1633]|nr:carbohydrate esterase family 3 protein [Hypoxylon sp. NC1633]
MAWASLEKGPEPSSRTARLVAFPRTKKAIAGFVALGVIVVGVIVVIVLAASGTIQAHSSSNGSKSEEQATDVSSSSSSILPTSTKATVASAFASTTSASGSASTSSLSVSTSLATTSSGSATPSTTPSATASSMSSTNMPLRIMALGASIVKGETSPGYLGFRKPMRDELVGLGFTVNMVGSVRLGDYIDNDVEAYGGKKITEMLEYAKKAVPQTLPNVFVINLGTNNLLQNKDVDKVGQQMADLIDYLLEGSNQSTVVLSTMLTNKVGDLEATVLDMNRQYRDIMTKFEADGKPVVLAEMHPSEGIPGVPTVDDIGPDGSHPTVKGYEMMGHIFVQAIQKASEQGFLREPVDNGISADGDAERDGSVES